MKNLQDPPAGAIAVIATKADGFYYFLTPLVPDRVNPTIWIPHGSDVTWAKVPRLLGIPREGSPGTFGVPRYVIPNNLREITEQSVVIPRVAKSNLGVSRDRWIGSFVLALGIMRKVWKEVSKGSNESTVMQEWLATGLTESIETASYILKNSGAMNSDGNPENAESYFSTLMVLIHWGGLWRLRKKRVVKGIEIDSAGGFATAGGGAAVTKLCHWCFRGWQAQGWQDITERRIAQIKEDYFLEGKLP